MMATHWMNEEDQRAAEAAATWEQEEKLRAGEDDQL